MESMVKSTEGQWALKCKHCNGQLHGIFLCQDAKYPGPPMFYPWHGYTKLKHYPDGHQRKFEAQLCISVAGQAQLAWLLHDLVRPNWWWRNSATVSGKLDCSQGVGNMQDQYWMNGSFHGRGANRGQDQDCDHDWEHGQNCGSSHNSLSMA